MANCRLCGQALTVSFVDLGVSPLANAYLSGAELSQPECFYPLNPQVCTNCFLVQVPEFTAPENIFTEYAYFSSYSDTWLNHAKRYTESAADRFKLDERSLVMEVASNDGYLLQYFKDANIPVLGIEPARNVAEVARSKGIPVIVDFWGQRVAAQVCEQHGLADLIVANNVLAHVPNIHDFVAGMKTALAREGVITVEFPHLLPLIQFNQYDTIYHEHFSYFWFSVVANLFAQHGLRVFDVEELPTHGGSLRVYACHREDARKGTSATIKELSAREEAFGWNRRETYARFEHQVHTSKLNLLATLAGLKSKGKTIVAYGAPAKGNTLLNYCGIGKEFIDYTVDKNEHKQGFYLPGSRLRIEPPAKIMETRPDYIFILPWNLVDEISAQLQYVRAWGGKFILANPEVRVF